MGKVVCRDLEEDELVTVSAWFVDRKWPLPPNPGVLPKTAYVGVDSKTDQLLAVVWLYTTNARVGIVDWFATNPKAGTRGIMALPKVLQYIEKVTEGHIDTFWSFQSNEKLAKMVKKKCGYVFTERTQGLVRVRRSSSNTNTRRTAHG